MISMSQTYSIRQMRKNGESISEIARKTGVSRNTVYAKLTISDLSPRMPVKKGKAKALDRYRGVIESWLDEDAANWRSSATPPAAYGSACATNTASSAANRPSATTSTTSRP